MATVANTIIERYGDRIRPYIIVLNDEYLKAIEDQDNIIKDSHKTYHKAYGALTESLYLVRPDRHIAFRSQPAELDPLLEYLGTIFVD